MDGFILDDYKAAADFIKNKTIEIPEIAIVLGSGLSSLVGELTDKTIISYSEIPNFPKTTVTSHKGELVFGKLGGKLVLVMSGRIHYYEGYSFSQVTFYVRVLKLLGIKTMVLTNAAGAINLDFNVGEFMLITDHIKFFTQSPVRGENIPEFGQRFFDLSDAYSSRLREIAKKVALDNGILLREGVYAFMAGPQFETKAEIKALRILGGDAVGMSTVGEAITANQCGIEVLGLSCLSNMAAGIKSDPVTDDEVIEITRRESITFIKLIKNIILNI